MHKQHKRRGIIKALLSVIMLLSGGVVMADVLTVPNTFVPGTAATANSVNQNFEAVETEVTDNANDIDTNAAGISTNASDINTNAAGISTNASDISTNATGIATNAADIATNASDIGTNATDIANNFNALDQRLIPLEAGLNGNTFTVDCIDGASGADELLNTVLVPGNTYRLNGICNGPIEVRAPAGVYRFEGLTGKVTDGIKSPATAVRYFVLDAYGPVRLIVDNLTISGEEFTSQTDGQYTSSIWVEGGAAMVLLNSDVKGGDAGVFVSDSGSIYIGTGVSITDFGQSGLAVGRGGAALVGEFLTVDGADGIPSGFPLPDGGGYSEALSAFQGGNITIQRGGSFTAGTDDGTDPAFERVAAGAYDNSMIRIQNNGTVSLAGGLESYRSSSVRIRTGTQTSAGIDRDGVELGQASSMRLENMTLTGSINIYSSSSHLRLQGTDQSGGTINVGGGNSLSVVSGSLSNNSSDAISIGKQAYVLLGGTSIGNSTGPGTATIEIDIFGILEHYNGTDFGSRDINCRTAASFEISDGTSIGTQTGC